MILLIAPLAACGDRDRSAETVQAGAPAMTKLADAQDRFLAAGELRLRYRDVNRGPGTPIVFIHGYTRSLEDWLMVADSFPTRRVIAYDVRGFGQSTKFQNAREYGAAMVNDVVALLDHLQIPKAHLVGHSMGALIAGSVAARHPDRVASAVLVAGPMYPDSAAFHQDSRQWVRELERGGGIRRFLQWIFPGMPDSVARGMSVETMGQNDSVAMVASMRAFGGLAVTSTAAARATVPVVVAVGDNDPLAPLSRSFARRWPNARLIDLPGVDHVQIMTRPEVLAEMRRITQ